jgi:hypothetical protein
VDVVLTAVAVVAEVVDRVVGQGAHGPLGVGMGSWSDMPVEAVEVLHEDRPI